MPVKSEFSLLVTAGSIPTTILISGGRSDSFIRFRSIMVRFHKAPGLSSKISPNSSWRPMRVPAYLFCNSIKADGAKLSEFSNVLPRVTTVVSRVNKSLINLVGRGVVVITVCGCCPNRKPNCNWS